MIDRLLTNCYHSDANKWGDMSDTKGYCNEVFHSVILSVFYLVCASNSVEGAVAILFDFPRNTAISTMTTTFFTIPTHTVIVTVKTVKLDKAVLLCVLFSSKKSVFFSLLWFVEFKSHAVILLVFLLPFVFAITDNHFLMSYFHIFPLFICYDTEIVKNTLSTEKDSLKRNFISSLEDILKGGTIVAIFIDYSLEGAEVSDGANWHRENFVVRHAQRIARGPTKRKLSFAFPRKRISPHFLLFA
jgi:hypothetical protein